MKIKLLTGVILSAALFGACRDKEAVQDETADPVVKIHLHDPDYVDTVNTRNLGDFFSIQLNSLNSDSFQLSAVKRIYEIYYDSSFTALAGKITVPAGDSIVNYQMFDRKGVLRLNKLMLKGSIYYGTIRNWYGSGQLSEVDTWDHGNRISDSSFYENGNPEDVWLFSNDTIYKHSGFYRNGQRSREEYYGLASPDGFGGAVFVVLYDSLTQKPEMFYAVDSVWQDPDNPGTTIGYSNLIPVKQAEIIRRKK